MCVIPAVLAAPAVLCGYAAARLRLRAKTLLRSALLKLWHLGALPSENKFRPVAFKRGTLACCLVRCPQTLLPALLAHAQMHEIRCLIQTLIRMFLCFRCRLTQ